MIEITGINYKDYCSLDIVAFLFARPGAMGEPGGVEIIDVQGCYYHTNYCYKGISYEQLIEVVPVLKDCKIGLTGHQAPEGWVAVVQRGRVMFEIGGVDEATAREALRLGMNKLPVKAKFVKKGE